MPNSRNISQSAATWFQPASATRASASGSSEAARRPIEGQSEGAITLAIAGRLAEARKRARNPIGGPVDQPGQRHARISEQLHGLRGVDEPCGRGFLAGKHRRPAKAFAKGFGEPADA